MPSEKRQLELCLGVSPNIANVGKGDKGVSSFVVSVTLSTFPGLHYGVELIVALGLEICLLPARKRTN